jgi:hypothetical protein
MDMVNVVRKDEFSVDSFTFFTDHVERQMKRHRFLLIENMESLEANPRSQQVDVLFHTDKVP